MRRKLSAKQREERNEARWRIIQEANKCKMRMRETDIPPTLYGMRNLHRAVFYCRQYMLVDGKTYVAAGFRPRALKPGKPKALKKLIEGR